MARRSVLRMRSGSGMMEAAFDALRPTGCVHAEGVRHPHASKPQYSNVYHRIKPHRLATLRRSVLDKPFYEASLTGCPAHGDRGGGRVRPAVRQGHENIA